MDWTKLFYGSAGVLATVGIAILLVMPRIHIRRAVIYSILGIVIFLIIITYYAR